jgi:anti-sigma B factor antagonist
MSAPASRLLVISCPIHGCEGRVRAVLTEPWTTEQQCPDCGAEFSVPSGERFGFEEMWVPVAALRLPTYEGEHVEVRLHRAFRIALVGRLDLFSSDALAKAWKTLPAPRRAVFDLTGATDLSPKGAAALLALCPPGEDDGRAAILIREGDAPQGQAFAGSPLVHGDAQAALLALGDVRAESRRPPAVTVRREEVVTAPLQPAKEGDRPAAGAPNEAKPVTQPRRRRLEVEDIGDVTVVNFVDRKILDEQNIQIIGEQLFSLVDQFGRTKILLSFGNVEFFSSAAHGIIITLNKKVQSAGGRLVLCNIDPGIYASFEIMKLVKFYYICRSEQEGLQAF